MGRPSTSQSSNTFVLYRFYAADDSLLYVGLTRNPGRRIDKHAGEKSWWSDVARIEIAHFDSLPELREAERMAIQSEKPRHNIRMNGVKRSRRSSRPDSVTSVIEEVEIDGLVGRFFHTFSEPRSEQEDKNSTYVNGRIVNRQGRVVEEVAGGLYAIETFSWWDGTPADGRKIVKVDDMLDWQFYDSSLEMQIALPCGESLPWRDYESCNGVREYWSGSTMFIHFICHSCRNHFPGFADYPPIVWRDGRPHLK